MAEEKNNEEVTNEDLARMMQGEFSNLNERFEKMDERFGKMDERFNGVDKKFEGLTDIFYTKDELDEKFKQVADKEDVQRILNAVSGSVEKEETDKQERAMLSNKVERNRDNIVKLADSTDTEIEN
ncbi:MAG: hypothetical protein WDZ40_01780 [Candidatus Spechtbacterales bacterium]